MRNVVGYKRQTPWGHRFFGALTHAQLADAAMVVLRMLHAPSVRGCTCSSLCQHRVGEGVSLCCHRNVVIVGPGPVGFTAALCAARRLGGAGVERIGYAGEKATFLAGFAKSVTVLHRRDSLRASRTMADRAKANAEWYPVGLGGASDTPVGHFGMGWSHDASLLSCVRCARSDACCCGDCPLIVRILSAERFCVR